jgi:hypothetical protein
MLIKKIKNKVLEMSFKGSVFLGMLLTLPTRIMADSPNNPWSSSTAVTADNIETATGQHMGKELSIGLIAGGVLLFAGAIGGLYHILNQSAEEKRSEGTFSSITKIILLILCVVIGVIFIGLGFTGVKALSS